nr:aromatic acid/H+ symport family MFS transporter [Xanthomonas arboricola]
MHHAVSSREWAIGVGRFGAIASSLCGGVLVDAGRLPAAPDLACSVSPMRAAIAVLGMRQPVR